MKRNTLPSIALTVVIILMGACNSDTWDELPTPIANFISEYFPFGELESYTESNGVEVVKIKKGATLTFDSNYDWTDVNGNGSLLPQQFLYDDLPDVLYRYLEGLMLQNSVYQVTRTADYITVELLDSQILYNQHTGSITYPEEERRIGALI